MIMGARVKDKYFKTTNMSYSQLKAWSKTEASQIEQNQEQVVKTNLRLLFRKYKKWTEQDSINAIKTINFIEHNSKINRNFNIVVLGYTLIGIRLKNRGYDVKAN